MTEKQSNPKDIVGSCKLPMHCVPDSVIAEATLAWYEGMLKYGFTNWAVAGVRASIYRSALQRHLAKWWAGQDRDPETGVHHLASVIACAGIIIDAGLRDKLTDDRPPTSATPDLIDSLSDKVIHLQSLFSHRCPRHWTIADSQPTAAEAAQAQPPGDKQ